MWTGFLHLKYHPKKHEEDRWPENVFFVNVFFLLSISIVNRPTFQLANLT